MNVLEEKGVVKEAAEKHGIDPSFLWGVYGTETSFGHNVSRSSTGAEGPFQFEPETARAIGLRNPSDFRESADKAAYYLSQAKHGGEMGMVAHYYGAPSQEYLSNVRKYGAQFGGANPQLKSAAQRSILGNRGNVSGEGAKNQFNLYSALGLIHQGLAPTLGEQEPGQYVQQAITPIAPRGQEEPEPLTNEPQTEAYGPEWDQSISEGTQNTWELIANRFEENKSLGQSMEAAGIKPGSAVHEGTLKLNGFLPGNAPLKLDRIDQGQDLATTPGGPILAPGNGEVIATPDNPGGFGFHYPVVRFTSGPLAGHEVYVGHTHSVLSPGEKFVAGQIISRTGHGTPNEGNARTPGWAEIGLWGPSGPLAAGEAGATKAGREMARLLGTG